jgi:hypothetical protein
MSELKVSGKITEVLEVQSGTSKANKDWTKMNFILDTGAQYNPLVCFSLFGQEKVDNFNKYNKVGDNVEVSFNVSSREYEGKWYSQIDAWKVFKANTEAAPELNESETDDLPF